MASVSIDDVSKYAGSCKHQAHISQAKAEHWAGPVRLVVDRGSKAKEAHRSQNDCNRNEREAEFRLVDALVPFREVNTNPVVDWS